MARRWSWLVVGSLLVHGCSESDTDTCAEPLPPTSPVPECAVGYCLGAQELRLDGDGAPWRVLTDQWFQLEESTEPYQNIQVTMEDGFTPAVPRDQWRALIDRVSLTLIVRVEGRDYDHDEYGMDIVDVEEFAFDGARLRLSASFVPPLVTTWVDSDHPDCVEGTEPGRCECAYLVDVPTSVLVDRPVIGL